MVLRDAKMLGLRQAAMVIATDGHHLLLLMIIPPGKELHSYGKSKSLIIGKSTINVSFSVL
jgi:hypothetical protein